MSDLTTMKRTEYVTAFFDSEADAEAAVARIEAEGIPRDQIRVVPGAPDAGADRTAAEPRQKGFFEALADMFMPAEDRYAYAEGLSRGGFLVSLYTTVDNRDRILDILDDAGTIDMDAREESWRAEGWQGYEASEQGTGIGATPVASSTLASSLGKPGDDAVEPLTRAGTASELSVEAPSTAATDIDTPSEGTIEVVEEKLRVGKRDAEQGRVRVRSYVVETPVEEEVSLRAETVRVERTPVDRAVGAEEAFVDRTIEATETAEEAVVSKEARVTEEISLEKAVDTRTETVRDTVRRTEVEVEDERLDRDK